MNIDILFFDKNLNNKEKFIAPNIIIAGGVGSFEPRKISLKECEKFEGKSIFYAVRNKDNFKNKNISIFGGGDSALDWALELSKFSKIAQYPIPHIGVWGFRHP